MDKKSTKDLMQMLDLKETLDHLAKANSVRWYGHVLRKDKNNILRRALDLKGKGWTEENLAKISCGTEMKSWAE